MKYASYYIESNGQPTNGYEETNNKRAAITRAREYARGNLQQYSGGCAVAVVLDGGDYREDSVLWEWYEHFNGGYLVVSTR